MTFSAILFVVSLVSIVLLLLLKNWEMRHGRVLAPGIRGKLDAHAILLKTLLTALRVDLEKLPPEAARLSRITIHEAALGLAAVARFAERHAHQLADLMSYKHRFEKRDTRSEFLKKVAEHKNGNGLDTTTDNGHNI
ncbi:MAG: hypothetical protein Q7S50_04310 [bacterium]|nr:hypothetical protein [bacterium]